jgi:DNA-binding NarL/FixJ family response regulator
MGGQLTGAPRASILVVEDEWITARDIQQTLSAQGYRVTAIASSAKAALASIEADRPDLALVDIRIEGPADGVELAEEVGRRWGLPVVYLTAHSDRETVDRLKATGPLGFVSKPFGEGQLLVAIEVALQNAARERERRLETRSAESRAEHYQVRSSALEERLRKIAAVVDGASPDQAPGAPLAAGIEAGLRGLTPRELELVRLLLANRRLNTIARDLGLSVHTVRNHLRSVFRKLGLHSQEDLLDAVPALPPDLQARSTGR